MATEEVYAPGDDDHGDHDEIGLICIICLSKVTKFQPEKGCYLEYDKLYVDGKCYEYNDILGQVVEGGEGSRWRGRETVAGVY